MKTSKTYRFSEETLYNLAISKKYTTNETEFIEFAINLAIEKCCEVEDSILEDAEEYRSVKLWEIRRNIQ